MPRQLALQLDGPVLLGLAGGHGLWREGLVAHLPHALAQPQEVARGQHRPRLQEVQERHHAARAAPLQVAAQVGDDDHRVAPLARELRLHLERAQALHLVAEEVDAEGILRREREHVDDAAAHGILPRLVDIIHVLETIAAQHVDHKLHVDPLAHVQLQRLLVQLLPRDDLLHQRVGIGDHAEAAQRRPRPVGRGLAQAAQHLGAEYLVGGILLPVLDGAAERRGKEQHLLLAQHLRQVVVEVTRLLEVAPDEDKRTTAPLHQRREEQRHGRGTQPAAMHPAHRGIGQQATRSLHVGMGGIELL